ncbi:MAG: hypothetical protein ABH836_02360 [Candidatus Omnitrophota bacterium]
MKRVRRYFNFGSYVLVFGILMLWYGEVSANNLSISNATITEQSTSAQTCKVQFDISWENSWRNGINYDATWMFIKYSTDSGTTWSHATLKTSGINPTGFSQGTGTGLDIVVPTDKKGAFLQRSADNNAMEAVSTADIQFVWDWNADGLSPADTVSLKVFGIEMVYIPQGSFYVGDIDNDNDNCFYEGETGPPRTVFQISSEDAITVADTAGNLYYDADNAYAGDRTGPIPAGFPKGYNAFYFMKYEITQGQYRDFLNTLTRTQQNTRTETDVSTDTITNVYVMNSTALVSDRQGIRCPAAGNGTTDPITFGCDLNGNGIFNESADGEWIACNYLFWMDTVAYGDWAGLRPITELEFEKACRGSNSPVDDEYAWGTTNITAFSSLTNTGALNEISGTAGANCNYVSCLPDGPVKVGMFATATSTREQAGAGYYGNMELSANVDERPVTVGNSTGRAYTGTHGDGSLSANGNATNSDWPGYVTSEVTADTGAGFRGGGCLGGLDNITVSVRRWADSTSVSSRYKEHGGRLARTAP